MFLWIQSLYLFLFWKESFWKRPLWMSLWTKVSNMSSCELPFLKIQNKTENNLCFHYTRNWKVKHLFKALVSITQHDQFNSSQTRVSAKSILLRYQIETGTKIPKWAKNWAENAQGLGKIYCDGNFSGWAGERAQAQINLIFWPQISMKWQHKAVFGPQQYIL